MPVNSTHADYKKFNPRWTKIRTVLEGEEAVKAAGETYLPKPSGMDNVGTLVGNQDPRVPRSEYKAYVERAMFYAATPRTVTGLVGSILRKKPDVEWPKGKEQVLDSITPRGDSLDQLLRTCLEEDIAVGRLGLLVDAPNEVTDDPDPFIAVYFAEAIYNWREDTMNGRRDPVMVVLREEVDDFSGDPFEPKKVEEFRVLMLGAPTFAIVADEEPQEWIENRPNIEEALAFYGLTISDFEEGAIYFQEVWRKNEDTADRQESQEGEKEYHLVRRVFPRKKGGNWWREIPFKFINPSDCDAKPQVPPVNDLVNVNLGHYRNSADLEHGAHMTSLPTPWAAGFELQQGNTLAIGAGVAWVAKSPQARAGMVEFTGQGLAKLESMMESKEKLMAVLGARLLEEQKKAAEAAETVRIRQAGEQSVLANIADTVSEGVGTALQWLAQWLGETEEATAKYGVKLNKDFLLMGIDPKMLTALMQSAQGGMLSWDTFYYNCERGELFPEGMTPEEERELIEAGLPGGSVTTEDDEEEEEEPDDRQTGEGGDGPHRHPFRVGDERTGPPEGEANGHTHPIEYDEDGNPTAIGEAEGHTHPVS